jgi:class 3 adenylate cyclase
VVTCPGCGATNSAENRFCPSCGTSLASSCPACGVATTPGQRFCAACGHALQPATTAVTPAAPVAERRVCSVLFADLVGFTPLSESRDAEQVRELLTEYFDAVRTVITRYGGVVEKFIGDAVMAVWGTPVATEEDAERAVRAALEVVATVAELGERAGASGLAARAGVVTGEVAVTLGASSEGMVAGDAVNTAARVQAAAEPGTVYVDGTTLRMAAAAIAFTEAGTHPLKGKSEPVPLWRAVRVLANVGGSQRVDGLEAPLIGRDPELRTIKELFHASADRRTPRLVMVTGPAGVGKSRLGWEFEKYVDGLADAMFWHRGRCLSYGEGVSFWALAEIVRQRFGIAEEDDADTAATKLRTLLPRFVLDPAERDYVGPRLGRLLGVTYATEGQAALSREELFAGWRLFFERLATDEPVVLLIEDAQHADNALLDFVDHLLDWARDVPIYVLMFGRPELLEDRAGWGAGRNRTVLALEPLDPRSMNRLLEALVPGMPAEAVAKISEQAQGNPLFAVETVRALIDRDVVVPLEGAYRLVGPVGALSVPDSLHGLLAARLDALTPEVRALVADAAVLGGTFPLEALVAVSGRPEDQVEPALQDLVRRGVLEVSADPLSPQQGTYRFTQNMLLQVAYDTLSRRDRKVRHLRVAAHLRATFANDGDEVTDVIARHYLDALDAVPDDPDAAELRDAAVGALVRAAERAERSGAPDRALENYTAAADLVEQLGTQDAALRAAGLLERAADTGMLVARHQEAEQLALRADALYRAHGQDRAAARARVHAGRAAALLGRPADGRRILTEAVEVLRPGQDADTVTALAELATVEIFDGNADAGGQLAEEALKLGQALEVPLRELAYLFTIRGISFIFANRSHEAIAALRYSAQLAERSDLTVVRARALLNLATVLTTIDASAAAEAATTAWELSRRVGARYYVPVAVINLALVHLLAGSWDVAATTLDRARNEDDLAENPYVSAVAVLLASLRGDLATARALTGWLDAIRDSDDAQDRSSVALTDMMLAVAEGRMADVVAVGRELLELAAALGMNQETSYWGWPEAVRAAFALGQLGTVEDFIGALDAHPDGHLPQVLRAQRDLARARLAAARGADADDQLRAAVDGVRAAGSPYHLAHAQLDLAAHLRQVGQAAEARPLVDEAAAVAERLGAAPLAARAEGLRSADALQA